MPRADAARLHHRRLAPKLKEGVRWRTLIVQGFRVGSGLKISVIARP
jgi:hypothetical protein